MKTYEEIRRDILSSSIQGLTSHKQIEDLAAKEYAKQWVEQVVKEISDSPHRNKNLITYYHLAIDAQ